MERLKAWDEGLLYWLSSWRGPWLERRLVRVTHLGDAETLILVVLLGAGFLLYMRRPRLAGVMVLVGLLSLGVEWGVKLAVQRTRPDIAARLIDLPSEPSFPSGHSLCSMAIYGSLALLLSRAVPRPGARYLVLVGVALSVVIGLTRPMIGVHYPSDVLAGWLAGLLCIAVTHFLADEAEPPG